MPTTILKLSGHIEDLPVEINYEIEKGDPTAGEPDRVVLMALGVVGTSMVLGRPRGEVLAALQTLVDNNESYIAQEVEP